MIHSFPWVHGWMDFIVLDHLLSCAEWDRESSSDKFRLCKSTQLLFTVHVLNNAIQSILWDPVYVFIWCSGVIFTRQMSLRLNRWQHAVVSHRIWADEASETKQKRSSQTCGTESTSKMSIKVKCQRHLGFVRTAHKYSLFSYLIFRTGSHVASHKISSVYLVHLHYRSIVWGWYCLFYSSRLLKIVKYYYNLR